MLKLKEIPEVSHLKFRNLIEKRMKKICENICDSYDAECEFKYTHEFSPTINWEKCVDVVAQAAKNIVGEENVNANCDPIMGSEDFGTFIQKVPGCFLFIGSANSENEIIPLHNYHYDYNDTILETSAELFAEIVRIRLSDM